MGGAGRPHQAWWGLVEQPGCPPTTLRPAEPAPRPSPREGIALRPPSGKRRRGWGWRGDAPAASSATLTPLPVSSGQRGGWRSPTSPTTTSGASPWQRSTTPSTSQVRRRRLGRAADQSAPRDSALPFRSVRNLPHFSVMCKQRKLKSTGAHVGTGDRPPFCVAHKARADSPLHPGPPRGSSLCSSVSWSSGAHRKSGWGKSGRCEDLEPPIPSSLLTGQVTQLPCATYSPPPCPGPESGTVGTRRGGEAAGRAWRARAGGHLRAQTLSPGGSRGSKTDSWSTTQAWCFPLKEAAWKPVAPMLKARTNHASAALNGEIYAIGGKASPRLRRRPPAPGAPGSLPSPWPCRGPGSPAGLGGRRGTAPHAALGSSPSAVSWAVPPATWASRGEARA